MNRRISVVMVLHAYYMRDARVRRYAEALIDSGHRVDVICLRDSGESPRQCHRGVNIIRVPFTRVRGSKIGYCIEYLTACVLLAIYLAYFSILRGYAVVHIHTPPDVLAWSSLVPKLLGAKIILDFHDPMPELYISKYSCQSADWVVHLLKTLERLSAQCADSVLTASEGFKKLFIARGLTNSNINVIRNFPDLHLFRRDKQAATPLGRRCALLYVGTISRRYGLDLAIRALPQLREAIPYVELRIIGKITGEGEDRHQLEELAFQLGVSDLVTFHEPVPLDRVAGEMAKSDIGIYTPVHDVHMDNAFSLKVGEFVAMGVPVLATRSPVMEDHVGQEGAAFIESGNVSEFVSQVRKLHTDRTYRARILRECEAFSQHNTWENEKLRYLGVIGRLVEPTLSVSKRPFTSLVKRISRVLLTRTAPRSRTALSTARARGHAGIRILTYHDVQVVANSDFCVSARDFAEQMSFVTDHYPIVPLTDVTKWLGHELELDRDSLAITFDDGLNGIVYHALAILQRYRVPSTVFLVEEFVKRGMTWAGAGVLSPQDIREMASAAVTIGSHGYSHVSLAAHDISLDRLQREVAGSKRRLEDLLGISIDAFAYPYGTGRDIDDRVVHAVRSAGYKIGLSSIHGINNRWQDPFCLRRVKVEKSDSMATFKSLVAGGMDSWAVVDRHVTFLQRRRDTVLGVSEFMGHSDVA